MTLSRDGVRVGFSSVFVASRIGNHGARACSHEVYVRTQFLVEPFAQPKHEDLHGTADLLQRQGVVVDRRGEYHSRLQLKIGRGRVARQKLFDEYVGEHCIAGEVDVHEVEYVRGKKVFVLADRAKAHIVYQHRHILLHFNKLLLKLHSKGLLKVFD